MTGRASGVLLHPTSLPGNSPVGDLGKSARSFLDWLASAGQSVWQVLPLGPVGHGFSPYDARSSFAGNLVLIDLEPLLDLGLLEPADLDRPESPTPERIDLGDIERWKSDRLRRAWKRARQTADHGDLLDRARHWAADPSQVVWLEDWALFMALKTRFEDQSWLKWPAEVRNREPGALAQARGDLDEEILYEEFVQYLFFQQLGELRQYADSKGVSLLGDLPFYPALDSCDVWASPRFFDLDESGRPLHVAGVPPDYFSPTGQRWGNPIYRWDRLADENYQWWVDRLAGQLQLVDRLRLDHFRGFAGFWEIPAADPTAATGQWRSGPGRSLFDAVRNRLGGLPFIAEDLGLITPDVDDLRAELQIPGMKVLQFAFDSADSPHVPHNLQPDTVLYTGTHDNDTAMGWLADSGEDSRQRAMEYLGATSDEFCWELLRAAQTSVADLVITPIQDVVGLDGKHRMNIPGTPEGNWGWRLFQGVLTDDLALRLRNLTEVAARCSQ